MVTMVKRLAHVAVLVVLGVMTTVATCWGIALLRIKPDTGVESKNEPVVMTLDADNKAVVFYPPDEYPGCTVLGTSINSVSKASRDEVEVVSNGNASDRSRARVWAMPDLRHIPTGEANWRREFQFGWPCRAMWGAEDSRSFGCFVNSQPAVNTMRLWNSEHDYSGFFWRYADEPHSGRVPTGVLPLGFAANSALFAFAWIGLLVIPKRITRALRRRDNRCAACGYSRDGLALDTRCPECGLIPAALSTPPQSAAGSTADR